MHFLESGFVGGVRYRDYGTTAVFRIKDTLFIELGQE